MFPRFCHLSGERKRESTDDAYVLKSLQSVSSHGVILVSVHLCALPNPTNINLPKFTQPTCRPVSSGGGGLLLKACKKERGFVSSSIVCLWMDEGVDEWLK